MSLAPRSLVALLALVATVVFARPARAQQDPRLVWRTLETPEDLATLVATDPHSPAMWRVNGPYSNLEEFARAWGCKEGDPMVRKQELRARIW